jgi:branched-chain amino acid aminotransferase
MSCLTVWVDGEFLPVDDTRASLMAHGLHYGTGVFEGIRCYPTERGPAIFRLDDHMRRFAAGADALAMSVDTQALGDAALELLRRNEQASAYIRPLAYFESGGLALDVDPLTPRAFVTTLPWKSHLGDAANNVGVRLRTSSHRRTPAAAVPPLKLCGNYVNSILAKLESTRAGYDEALFVDDDGYVCEATGENVFMVKGGRVTAVEHRDALSGITKATVISLTGADSRPVHMDELRDADEVFLTGTSAEVAWVSEFDAHRYGQSVATREIAMLYQDVVHGRRSQHEEWLTWA